jgi:D-arabinose 1-dehydrogenase-like Zn-dependent alcohol dehydrogenase
MCRNNDLFSFKAFERKKGDVVGVISLGGFGSMGIKIASAMGGLKFKIALIFF